MKKYSVLSALLSLIAFDTAAYAITAKAGEYINQVFWRQDCKPGCYCVGSSKRANWYIPDVEKGCKERWSKVSNINVAGVYLCPADFPKSLAGAKSAGDCYFENDQGMKIYNNKITCPAGQYLPAKINVCHDCPVGSYCEGVENVLPNATKDQGIKACASDKTTKGEKSSKAADCVAKPKKSCSAGNYSEDNNTCIQCPGGFYCEGGTKGKTPCPEAIPKHWRDTSTFPANYYASDGDNVVEFISAYIPKWDSLKGKKSVTDCRIVYSMKNMRGRFNDEATTWNASTSKYDKGGNPYYLSVNPGFYMSEKLESTYCDNKFFEDGKSKKSMLYKQAIACPSDKYCPGVKQTYCDSGTYEDTLGLKDPIKVSCSSGYYLPAFKEVCDKCPADRMCPGGDFLTKHIDQGPTLRLPSNS